MVLVQKLPYFQLFFLGNIDQENVFYDILEWKTSFLGYKNKKFKKSIFPKGLNTWLKHSFLHRSIDVKFIFDSARLGLSSSANILEIADVALRVVCLLFLPCFWLVFRLVLFLEASEMSAVFLFHKQNNLTSSPGFLG